MVFSLEFKKLLYLKSQILFLSFGAYIHTILFHTYVLWSCIPVS